MKRYCIIVAGGVGRRMGGEIPKQFITLCGKPVLMHTIERFYAFDRQAEIIVVLPADHISYWKELLEQYSFTVPHVIVQGGEERYFSVKAALAHADEKSFIAVHDGVRPLVSRDTIDRCFSDAEKYGNAIPFIEPADSVRTESDGHNAALSRKTIRLIQTPQVFDGRLIKKAYELPYNADFTDDASVIEAAGFDVHLTPGNRENIKITTPGDIVYANAIILSSCSYDEKR